MNKITSILVIVLLITISCSNDGISKLNDKVLNLEKENLLLKDSIKNLSKIDLETRLTGIPSKDFYHKNEEGKIFFFFLKSKETTPYNIYESNEKFEKGKLLYSNITKSEFVHKFTPTKSGVNEILLIAEIRDGKYTTEIPAFISINVKE